MNKLLGICYMLDIWSQQVKLLGICVLSAISLSITQEVQADTTIWTETNTGSNQVTFTQTNSSAPLTIDDFYQSYADAPNISSEHIDTIYQSEQNASEAGKRVLQIVRQMALENQEIISGGCWDYLNVAFNRASLDRQTLYSESYPNGPFVSTDRIQPGDWLYYVNHSYNDIEHSGLFVGWVDQDNNQALILSYAGERRQEPARYKVYDVSDTYHIIRPILN